jgi:hypothetical protein
VSVTLCRRLFLHVGLACLGGLAFYAAGACFARPRRVFLFEMPGVSPHAATSAAAGGADRLRESWLCAQEEAAWRTLLAA